MILVAFGSMAMAQPGKTTTAPKTTPPKTTAPVLKNLDDSASYAIGLSVASFYKQQGIKNLSGALVTRAINDVVAGKKTLFDDATATNVMNAYMTKLQSEKSKPRIDSGAAFLAKNKLRKEVKTTASGLQYEVLTEGTGPKPTAKDSVTCNYMGTLLDGTEVDNSYKRGEPITFALSGVITGWTEGLQLMSVGSKYKFYIPYNLGYGAFDYGPIPGGSTLTFVIELLAVKKGP
jgi:FKBP-type peptidyl-prolyl cis-trans isomerase